MNILNDKTVTQEFIVRVQVTTSNSDPKVIRALLDKIEYKLKDLIHKDDAGTVQVLLVHPN